VIPRASDGKSEAPAPAAQQDKTAGRTELPHQSQFSPINKAVFNLSVDSPETPAALAERAVATIVRLCGSQGASTLREITALFQDVQFGDPDTSWAIGRICQHLEGKATDGDIASVWDQAIRKAREWRERAEH
jgi:hypothetical protein